ncbi:MAG: hypothetical protein HZB38_07845 [Planctomycetes bacterium]|nr:hypothetical protein [Planctomycetota bacterium]
MQTSVGIDVGAISVKAAVLVPAAHADDWLARHGAPLALRRLATACGLAVVIMPPRRTRGRPREVVAELLAELLAATADDASLRLMLTGSGAGLLAAPLGADTCNDFQACARAISALHPDVRTVFELGGESSRYIRLASDPADGRLSIVDYCTNGDCAAGTGAFLDQQAGRLQYCVEEIGGVACDAQRCAQIAGRCSVFAKSDMIHAQQKGFQPPEVLRGLCLAVATNFKSAVVKGRPIHPPVAFVGGVSANSAVVAAIREVFELHADQLLVPSGAEAFGAIGAALLAGDRDTAGTLRSDLAERLTDLGGSNGDGYEFSRSRPLSLQRVRLLRNQVRPYRFPESVPVDAYLGIDIGSVGTKLVLIDAAGEVIHSIFTRTEGRPIEVVSRALHELEEAVGWAVRIRGVGTTGSGRELIGELVGADSINDEITAHKTGATFIGDRLLGKRPDTIFEIGGQDSKYIRLQEERHSDGQDGNAASDTIVVDFTMNEACAAGTGSFLEERAAELGVSIKDEFSELAFRSKAPIRLGERCTVFMERDVNTCMQRGAAREDLIAGLAYSVAYNYINRVVRGRPIGECVFFQGGTAYNDAVAAAFSLICDKEIIVPPHNAVLGAVGAALLSREKMSATGGRTRFRGYDLGQVNYTLREFPCKACSNHCSIQEFNVEGEKTFWGDKCSDRFRKQAKSGRQPVIADLVALRQELMDADDHGDPPGATRSIGLPMAMYTWDWLPMWRRFFRDCGFRVVVSTETNRTTVRHGLECAVAEPCFPIIVAHGHVADLVDQRVDYIWLPNLISAGQTDPGLESHVCPWGGTLPFVIRQAPAFRSWGGRILCPTLALRDPVAERETLVAVVRDLGVAARRARRAFDAGFAALLHLREAYERAGREALRTLEQTGEPGMVLVGRPYNIHDAGVSLGTARKLREQYGVNILPIDALPLADIDVSDVNDNMYWSYGRKILAAGKLVAAHPNLHVIYITNFKCGPDSYLKGFMRSAAGKPFLTLQFDGHSNDAGLLTRCEAYLDSKGILRWWRTCRSKPAAEVSPAEPSTCPRWHTPSPG